MNRALHSDFAEFFEKPSKKKLKMVLSKHFGEFDHVDFKGAWPESSTLARHVLALANSEGGALIFGVQQGKSGVFHAKGLSRLEDKAKIKDGLKKFIPDALPLPDILDFSLEGDGEDEPTRLFQVLFVDDLPEKTPFVCTGDGKGVDECVIYARTGTSSEPVTYEQLQKILSRRIETQYSASVSLSIDEHLDQLERLYNRIPMHMDPYDVMFSMEFPRNPNHPRETYEEYVAQLIESKKELIDGLASKT